MTRSHVTGYRRSNVHRPDVEHAHPAESGSRDIDILGAERAAELLLTALGVETLTPRTADTARRMARAYAELLTPPAFSATTFPNDEGYSQLVIVKMIPFTSLCEHHFLPFCGVAHIGYLPCDKILGLSKFARLVHSLASRPQVQERLTQQIADWLEHHLRPRGVGVILVAEHLCMAIRGVRAPGAKTVTSALHGDVLNDQRTREEFFLLTGAGA
jgi:GTP cyclohydrolase I